MPPKAKKGRAATARVRDAATEAKSHHQSKQASLPGMPLDIIFEILAYVEPLDLLHIARVSKDFRAFLMKRSSAHLWQVARHNIGQMPSCRQLLSEPAYISLAFEPSDRKCSICSKSGSVRWSLGKCLCDRCCKYRVLKSPRDEVDLPGASRVVFTDEICRNVVVIVEEPMGRYAFNYVWGKKLWKADRTDFIKAWKETKVSERDGLLAQRIAWVQEWNMFRKDMQNWELSRRPAPRRKYRGRLRYY